MKLILLLSFALFSLLSGCAPTQSEINDAVNSPSPTPTPTGTTTKTRAGHTRG